ncbi:MAG: sugar phosphate isomerase/epimerase [Treponema sp.]|nr:sugar phosphate isomerase/epimerase [Treponema sp.]
MYKALSSELLWFKNRTLKDDCPLAAAHGYRGVGFDIIQEERSMEPMELTDLLARYDLAPMSFALPVEFRLDKENFDSHIACLGRYCQFAQALGAGRCTAYILPHSDTLDYPANFRQYKERLKIICRILGDWGIKLGLEFLGPPILRQGVPHEFIHDLKGLVELIDAVDEPNLGHLLDLFHWDMAGQTFKDFEGIPQSQKIIVAHLSDAPLGLSRDEQPNHKRELPGATGVLHTTDFIRGLRSLDYQGPVFVEPFNEELNKLPFEEAVKAAKVAMDRVLEE